MQNSRVIGALSFDGHALPAQLAARVCSCSGGLPGKAGAFVLYWMRMAVRDHDNAALDTALVVGNRLGLPVLVYHGVSERYPYASDRHHTFILEGARDVAGALSARGIDYALHVERPGARGPVLWELAKQAALVVTEHVPVPPLDEWTARLAARLSAVEVPLWAVDASCVVPMPLTKKRYERAFAFRKATVALAKEALDTSWPVIVPEIAPSEVSLPFARVPAQDLSDRELARLVAQCAIDHAVGPVRESRGGSVAGYGRWEAFREHGLRAYARTRNDALALGVSRLSPYFHYGHVSALRVAREALAYGGSSAEKFLDELLIWREAAWHFADKTKAGELHSLKPIPEWAKESFADHESDPRTVFSTETFERARTGDPLWDAAQQSLLAHGELHNNLRMTWGKAVATWTESAEAARRMLVDLNHRYALDGRDPASYGGLYWCLGLFDRPFTPHTPVLGSVRARPTEAHSHRLDVAAYAKHVARPSRTIVKRVAVIGAGLAGLACARTLRDHNIEVEVFDKGRAPGGRLANRRALDLSFDLGAQYFTARDPRFVRWVESWQEDGICAPWRGRIVAVDDVTGMISEAAVTPRWVGTPNMSALARHLARDVAVRASQRVDAIDRRATGMALSGAVGEAGTTLAPFDTSAQAASSLGQFEIVLVCLPAPQASALLATLSPALSAIAAKVAFTPCFAAGITGGELPDALASLPFDGAFIGRDTGASPLAWVARDTSKPGRGGSERWTLHAATQLSQASLEAQPEAVARTLAREFARLFRVPEPEVVTAHRWRYARAPDPETQGAYFDQDAGVGLAGDWLAGGRVEGAVLSGVALAGRVLGSWQ